MKNNTIIIAVTLIISILYSQTKLADDLSLKYKLNNIEKDSNLTSKYYVKNNIPITIKSKYAEINYPNNYNFIGEVKITNGDIYLNADKVILYHKYKKNKYNPSIDIEAHGNVYYRDNQIILEGIKCCMDINSKNINIWKGKYQVLDGHGYGAAEIIKQICNGRFLVFKKNYFTTCKSNLNTWKIKSDEAVFDRKNQTVKIWNAYFKLGNITIFYIPYLQLPIGNTRHSGFLIPNIKFNSLNKLEFYLPYYWNINSNMDLTITPHYINNINSILWENELRYVNKLSYGSANFNFINLNDKIYNSIYKRHSQDWLFKWRNNITLNNNSWHFNIDYTKISNLIYFNKLNYKYNDYEDYYNQIFDLNYSKQNFYFVLSSKKFYSLKNNLICNYVTKPQLDINWYICNINPFKLQINGQIANFINKESYLPKAIRIHLESKINLPWHSNLFSLNTEAKFMNTFYKQKNFYEYNEIYGKYYNMENSIKRFIPQFKIFGKTVLERNVKYLSDYIQLLEPEIQYLYIPYKKQNTINNYDSLFLTSDFNFINRDYIYSGIDKIASMNQLTTVIKTRIYNRKDISNDIFKASIGQIYFFNDYFKDTYGLKKNNKTGSIIWVSNFNWYITNYLNLYANLNYNKYLNGISSGNAAIEYHKNENSLFQLNYRYVNSKYIKDNLYDLFNNKHKNREGIFQLGIITNWSINNNWSIMNSCYINTNKNKLINQAIGLKYHSCCYKIHLEYERKLNNLNIKYNKKSYTNLIGFNIELSGLNSKQNSAETNELLNFNTLPYFKYY